MFWKFAWCHFLPCIQLTLNLYANKQRWKLALLIAAAVIAFTTLWVSNRIASSIRIEEQEKVRLWSEAIRQRAELVGYTQQLFDELGNEEREKADLLSSGYRLITDPPDGMDLTFVTEFLWANKTIPVLFYEGNGELLFDVNVPEGANKDSLRAIMEERNGAIVFPGVGTKVYWDESVRLNELRAVMDDLIHSFISETVMNSASVPVLITNGERNRVIRAERIDSLNFATPEALSGLLEDMSLRNEPIALDLPNQGRQYLYYADSVVLTQLRYYPVLQLVLIAVFLLVAYLIFSSYRRAEQNQVWVGMAKETAHQLGTPMSSLMAWIGFLEAEGVSQDYLKEMNRDVDRLNMVVDRFSKIGSKPNLLLQDPHAVVQSTVEYMRPRIGSQVSMELTSEDALPKVPLSPPLFSWVLENLIRNAVDAMEGEGDLTLALFREGAFVCLDVRDTGKGIPRSQWKEVFAPGFTTKSRGWGLGLSLTKRIIQEYHNGKISVQDSRVGEFTNFRVMLPISPVE